MLVMACVIDELRITAMSQILIEIMNFIKDLFIYLFWGQNPLTQRLGTPPHTTPWQPQRLEESTPAPEKKEGRRLTKNKMQRQRQLCHPRIRPMGVGDELVVGINVRNASNGQTLELITSKCGQYVISTQVLIKHTHTLWCVYVHNIECAPPHVSVFECVQTKT